MPTLDRSLRKDLENTVKKARRTAEPGARKAIEQLAVHHHEAWGALTPEQRSLRNRLRAHGRQLGDRRDEKSETQAIERLVAECAYEHWHRLLFARFLAESGLLIEPESGVAITLDECRELARERDTDWLALASAFAVRMLPQIFRKEDPVLEIKLPPETRQALETLIEALPSAVFTADDSLGWVYQFWQSERKDEVNESGVKIGPDELAPATQLFTEDYMVLFLLHNTLGAWWTAKRRSEGKDPALLGYECIYLRVRADGTAAAGGFEVWPRSAKDLRLLDPCMGSGHFLVFALPILVAFRMEEEGLSREEAVEAVLRDNLFGLELDPRCAQIAAFNLALSAWRAVGYRPLPALNLACSGLGINAKEEDWIKLAGEDSTLCAWMSRLYGLFSQAPLLGSLIAPKRALGDIFAAQFVEVRPLLERALAAEQKDDEASELAATARGLLQAARVLSGAFTLVVTNVPYLGRGKQEDGLKDHCSNYHSRAKADLSTCFVERCVEFCERHGSIAVVTPQNWLFLGTYEDLRCELFSSATWNLAAKLGPAAFEDMNWWAANTALLILSNTPPTDQGLIAGLDVSAPREPAGKAVLLRESAVSLVLQKIQLKNPDTRLLLKMLPDLPLLQRHAESFQGIKTGDDDRLRRFFWELPGLGTRWRPFQSTVESTRMFGGLESIVDWADEGIHLARRQGLGAWGKLGVIVSQMGQLPVALYLGDRFDSNASPIIPRRADELLALWAFCSSAEYRELVRAVDQKTAVTNSTLVKVPLDMPRWQRVASATYPDGLPMPDSGDPTQCLFGGHPRTSEHPLEVAVARLAGYRWPRQTGTSFPECPVPGPDGLEKHADGDGIACLAPLKGAPPAADRLRSLLADAFGDEWSGAKQAELLAKAGHAGVSLEEWLRDSFFEEHCELFHQRPFVWHVWDGLTNGFSALVNYHRLAAANGDGRRTLEKLIYTYMGDWIDRQEDERRQGIEGAEARVAAAKHLKVELERVLAGEPPYDIFVRWKSLHEQPVGWEPDIDDGVRINIRPFLAARPLAAKSKHACILRVRPKIKWEKDRGGEPKRAREDFPWFWGWDGKARDFEGSQDFDGNRWNGLHYTGTFKRAARERKVERTEERRHG